MKSKILNEFVILFRSVERHSSGGAVLGKREGKSETEAGEAIEAASDVSGTQEDHQASAETEGSCSSSEGEAAINAVAGRQLDPMLPMREVAQDQGEKRVR